MKKYFPYGVKHEVAKRWPLWDWHKSKAVEKKIDSINVDKIIYDLIVSGSPALVGRLGGTEARFIGEFKKISELMFLQNAVFFLKPNWRKRAKEINNNAGFYFQSIKEAGEFYNMYKNALINTDALGAWGTAFSYIESHFIERIQYAIPVGMTAPWIASYSETSATIPWSKALEGKKVLVISAFEDSIKKQFKNIAKVFPNQNFHNFELLTIRSPMTIGTSYPVKKSWFQLLDEMTVNMEQISFDVALVSAGSYSYPLAHHAKKLGKVGIHAGGGLQLFFGIMGRRWEKSQDLLRFVNPHWIRPSIAETPKTANLVENGCYW